MDLNDIAKRIKAGDDLARHQLVGSFGNMIYYTAFASLKDEGQALDASKRVLADFVDDLSKGNVPKDSVSHLQSMIGDRIANIQWETDILNDLADSVGLQAGIAEEAAGAHLKPSGQEDAAGLDDKAKEGSGAGSSADEEGESGGKHFAKTDPDSAVTADLVPVESPSEEEAKALEDTGSLKVINEPAGKDIAHLDNIIPEVVASTQPMKRVSDGSDSGDLGAVADAAEDEANSQMAQELHRQFFGDTSDRAHRSRIGFFIGVCLAIVLALVLVWLVLGFMVKLGVFPNLDLGYSWFNRAVYPIF